MSGSAASSVDDVIVPPSSSVGQSSGADETQALLGLSQVMAEAPDRAAQRLVESAMKLTGADSAGLSLEDTHESQPVFRWVAVTGEFSRYLHATMPRDFSPCGTVVARRKTLIMRSPVRFFPCAASFHAPLHTVLLTPFGRSGRLVGTVWVVSHDPRKDFNRDHVRIVEGITTFATSILDALHAAGGRSARGSERS